MDAISIRKPPHRGFTLVEMLVVVVIIGILASLVTGAVSAARRRARIAAVALEIKNIEMAMKAYKEKFGDYPPDFTNPAAVKLHLARAYPRYTGDYVADLNAAGVDVSKMDPASAVVFWLGGIPAAPGSKKLIGFSTNQRNPFDNSASRTPPFFEFDPRRLKPDGGVLRYYPDTSAGGATAPYVYLRARSGGYEGHPGFALAAHPEWGSTGPCRDTRVPVATNNPPYDWVNRDSFQIRAAGLDGRFGAGVLFPTGEDYDEATFDDQGNFVGGTLEDEM